MPRIQRGFVAAFLATLATAAVVSAQQPCPTGDCDGSGGSLIDRMRANCQYGECRDREYGSPDLFYNFWAAPTCGGVGAQLYLAPHPIPANVGHTYITYQPLMPHEMLYPHSRTYHRYYDEGRGITRARVNWSKSGDRAANMMEYFRIAR